MDLNDHITVTVSQLLNTWNEVTNHLITNPELLIKNHSNYWQEYTNLLKNLSTSAIPCMDKRFQHSEWQQNVIYYFIKQSYLLLNQHVDGFSDQIKKYISDKTAQKFHFFSHQFIDAFAPTNFPGTNPEILDKIIETNGKNLHDGFKQFLDDLVQGKGKLNIAMCDKNSFQLGKNIACTPGKVIYQNDIMQLIQYTPTTQKIFQHPLLIIPPWINKFYILDLQPENSLVKWLVDQGFPIFMISWVNPTQQHKDKTFEDYLLQGPIAALTVIAKISHNSPVNLLGYCIGGTLLGCLLAYLSKKKFNSIHSATFLTTLFDFSNPGEIGAFIDEPQISILEAKMQENGFLDGKIMSSVFNALRANDLIWASFINNYLKGQKPKPFDLLYWNDDATNIPALVHSFYLRNMYLNNFLVQPKKIKLAKVPIDLKSITIPCYFLAAHDDHIVPWQSCYTSQQLLTAPVRFVLANSGHVAGVVNHPDKNKYGYWTNTKLHQDADSYLKNAVAHDGSWWSDWIKWLKPHSGKLQSANKINLASSNIIEEAPGSYVKVRFTD